MQTKNLCNFILQLKKKRCREKRMEMTKDSEWNLEVPVKEL